MARHEVTAQIIKSSNDFGYSAPVDQYYNNATGTVDAIYMSPVAAGNLLEVAGSSSASVKKRIGIAWDDGIVPKNKKLINATIHFYTTRSHNQSIFYRYANFAEGSTIPTHEPSDGSKNGANSGWGSIDLGEPKGNSVILYANLRTKTIYIDLPGIPVPQPFTVSDSWAFYSQRSSINKPYVILTYEDIPPDPPTSLYPSDTTASTRDVIRFSWLHNSKEGLQQKGFELQYSLNGGSSWITINQNTANQFYDMPANTLPTSGNVIWRVRTTDGNNAQSAYTTASFTLGIVPQKAPVLVAPISQYIENGKPIKFEWVFVGGSEGETQSKFDLQYSINGGSSWTTKSGTTSNYYEIAGGTFNGGNITWRVRTYNNWNEVSPYSENKSFTVIGSPIMPIITNVSNSARPLINWQSTEQHLYELQVIKENEIILDTGSIPSTTDKSFKVDEYLTDGNYKARLRIANEYNLLSPWNERNFTINTTKPQKPKIMVFGSGYLVEVRIVGTGTKMLVYRDSILIGEAKDNVFFDYTGKNNIEHQYFVRNISTNDSFIDSEVGVAKCKFRGNSLALKDNPSDIIKILYGFNDSIRKSSVAGVSAELVYFDGRSQPITEFSEFKEKSKSLTFYLPSLEEINRLIAMINKKKIFIYRDNDGENIYGSILIFNYEKRTIGYEVTFLITETEV